MESPEFYYGLPESQWDPLLVKAEDLLRDEGLGSHLVGIYPAGQMIYGVRSEYPDLFCLYIDSVDALINPAIPSKDDCHIFQVEDSQSKIVMMDLFRWAQWLSTQGSGRCSIPTTYLAHALPLGQDIFHQDESLCDILDAAKALMTLTKFFIHGAPGCIREQDNPMAELGYYRTQMILTLTGKFYPSMDPEFGKVFNLASLSGGASQRMIDLDAMLRNDNLNRGPCVTIEELKELRLLYINKTCDCWDQNRYNTADYIKLVMTLGAAVANLYRFQL